MAADSSPENTFELPGGPMDSEAAFQTGRRLARCRRGGKQFSTGLKLLLQAADEGHADACLLVSQLYLISEHPQQLKASKFYLERAISSRLPSALLEAGLRQLAPVATSNGPKAQQAIAMIHTAARTGDTLAQQCIALLQQQGAHSGLHLQALRRVADSGSDGAADAAQQAAFEMIRIDKRSFATREVQALLRKAADVSHPEACYCLGELLASYPSVQCSQEHLCQVLRWAEGGDFPVARVLHIHVLAKGIRGPPDLPVAMQLCSEAVEGGNMHVAAFCGGHMHMGTGGFKCDTDVAARLLRLAAGAGSHAAALRLAWWRLTGIPCALPPPNQEQPLETAEKFLRSVLSDDDPLALCLAGYAHWEGLGGVAQDKRRGADLLCRAARLGCMAAAPLYTQAVLQHILPMQLLPDALQLVRKGAKCGHMPCVMLLAQLLTTGRGLQRDQPMAALLLRNAASLGYLPAQDALHKLGLSGVAPVSAAAAAAAGVCTSITQQLGPSLGVHVPALPAARDVLTGAAVPSSKPVQVLPLPAKQDAAAHPDTCLAYLARRRQVAIPLPAAAAFHASGAHQQPSSGTAAAVATAGSTATIRPAATASGSQTPQPPSSHSAPVTRAAGMSVPPVEAAARADPAVVPALGGAPASGSHGVVDAGFELYAPQHPLQQALEGYIPGRDDPLPAHIGGMYNAYHGVLVYEASALGPAGTPTFDQIVYRGVAFC